MYQPVFPVSTLAYISIMFSAYYVSYTSTNTSVLMLRHKEVLGSRYVRDNLEELSVTYRKTMLTLLACTILIMVANVATYFDNVLMIVLTILPGIILLVFIVALLRSNPAEHFAKLLSIGEENEAYRGQSSEQAGN